MKRKNIIFLILTLTIFVTIQFGCSKDDNADNTINIFSVQDDIAFGEQMREEIHSNPADYPLLSETQYALAYQHIYRIRDSILESGDLKYTDKFEWKVDIIQDDSVLNAFCSPGANICVYTGIIK